MLGLAIRGIHTMGPRASDVVVSTYMGMDGEPGSSVGIATDYGVDGPGSNFVIGIVVGPMLQQACGCGELVLLFKLTLDSCNDRYN